MELEESRSEFDYVVVAGGAAGCVVAARLSEDPGCRVLLLEAGPVFEAGQVSTPGQALQLLGTDAVYPDQTVAQDAVDDKAVQLSSGRGLGDGTSVNTLTRQLPGLHRRRRTAGSDASGAERGVCASRIQAVLRVVGTHVAGEYAHVRPLQLFARINTKLLLQNVACLEVCTESVSPAVAVVECDHV